MEDFFAHVLGYTALGFVLLVIGLGLRKIVQGLDVRGLPDADRRLDLLSRLRQLRADGANHQECVAFLRREGLRGGVAKGLVIDLEREQPADVAHPRTHTWNGFRFDYPGNWKIEPLFDAGSSALGISVEGIGSCMVMFVQLIDEDAGFEELVHQQKRQLRDPDETPFEHWGPLAGEGLHLEGPHRKLRIPVEIDVFHPLDASLPFAIVQYHAVEEAELVAPGFELIQRTLERAA